MRRDPLTLRWSDLLWIFAIPVYLLVGTTLHEGSHALVAFLLGARVESFTVIPSPRGWGAVEWSASTMTKAGLVMITVAPYVMYLFLFLVSWIVTARLEFRRRWCGINVIIVGLAAPIIDAGNNYAGFAHRRSDTAQLLRLAFPVHAFFVCLFVLYLIGLWHIQHVRRLRFARSDQPPNTALQLPAAPSNAVQNGGTLDPLAADR